MLNKLPVLEAATWVDVIVSSIKQSRKDCSFENLVNCVWKRHLPRKWQIYLSFAWLKGCDIVVAKVRFNLYQSVININRRKGWPKIGISLFILHRRIKLSKMIRFLTNIICKSSILNSMAIILLLQILTSIAATVPFVYL